MAQREVMAHEPAADLASIDDALLSVRAAVDLVASHAASRVTVHVTSAERILPAARAIGRSAGVKVEPMWWPHDAGCDIVVGAALRIHE